MATKETLDLREHIDAAKIGAGLLSAACDARYAVAHDAVSDELIDLMVGDMSRKLILPDSINRGRGSSSRPVVLKDQNRSAVEFALLSSRRLPAIKQMAACLTKITQGVGHNNGIGWFGSWNCNRAVMNRLVTTPEDDGQLYHHTDPERFRGVVITASAGSATLITDHRDPETKVVDKYPEPLDRGDVAIFLGHDFASKAHGGPIGRSLIATEPALESISFAHDGNPTPIGIHSLVNRLKDSKTA